VNQEFQTGIHPDADQLSVFVEGAATSREQERMLTHLAECAECRKAVFFMQPQEETQPATRTPAKGWIWGRLLPVGLPAAALACGLVAVLVHIWPRDGALRNPQQVASLRKPEVLPKTTVAPSADSEMDLRSGTQKRSLAPASNLSMHENLSLPKSLNLPESSGQAAAKVAAPETTTANLSANAPVGHGGGAAGGEIGATVSNLPLNGRNFSNLQQLSTPADTKAAASQNSLAKKKDLGGLMIEQATGHDKTLAEVSGHITDRSGAIVAGVTVMLRDAGGKTRQTTTSADGSFNLTGLPAGRYELIATASGFKTIERAIELNPSQLAMMEPVLDVGAVSETVEVASAAAQLQTESANVSQVIAGQVVSEMPNGGRAVGVPSGLPVTATVSHGKRFISLDNAGNLFLSRNGGKRWKKIRPQWTGKAVRIELSPAYSSGAPPPKNETLGKASEAAVFLLTTDAGTVWTSKDGAHWQQQ
jgi:hypothetical protein